MAPKKGGEKPVAGGDAGGKEIEQAGLPDGWKAIEKVYQTGSQKGQKYVRFHNEHHSCICSVRKAIELHASDTGQDPAKALKDYDAAKKAISDAKKAEREQKGLLEGKKKTQAVEVFRAKFGKLDGATVCKLPGWRGESKLLEKCGQICARYYSPSGEKYSLINQIEAFFGFHMMNGEDHEVPDIEAARTLVEDDGTGKKVNTARSGDSVKEDFTVMPTMKRQKKDKVRVARLEDYRSSKDLKMIPLLRDDSEAALADTADPEEVLSAAEDIHRQLVERGFDLGTALLYMTPAKHSRVPNVRMINAVGGIYFRQAELFSGRPYYQHVRLVGPDSNGLACSGNYISWSSHWNHWKIGNLDEGKAGLAICRSDVQAVTDADQPWMLYEPPIAEDGSSEDPPDGVDDANTSQA